MKMCELCGDEIATKDGDNRCAPCERAASDGKRRKRAAAARRLRHQTMVDLGLTRVRGALGGIYYE